jgi:hypothetical protein
MSAVLFSLEYPSGRCGRIASASGVDYDTVQYFRQDPWNRFQLTERIPALGTEKIDSDGSLDTIFGEFEKDRQA